MFQFFMPKLDLDQLSSAHTLTGVLELLGAYVTRLRRSGRLPASCRAMTVETAADLFNWWIELDRLCFECRERKDEAILFECRAALGAAWQRATELGYKLPRARIREGSDTASVA
jgi:hypothetical protein